jgi:hypothetical protein
MQLFTFILDFNGGTYISQVQANNVTHAMDGWLHELNLDEIYGLTNRSKGLFRACFTESESEPVPVNEVVNVWFAHTLVRGNVG